MSRPSFDDDDGDVNPDELFNMLAQQSNVIEVPVYEQEDGSIRLGVGVQIKSADDEDDNVYASTPDTPTAPFNRQLSRANSVGVGDKLQADDVSDVELRALADALYSGVKPSDIRAGATYKDAVLGKAVVDWVKSNVTKVLTITSKNAGSGAVTVTCQPTTAVALLDRMFTKGWIHPCDEKKKVFEDGASTYRYWITVLEDEKSPASVFTSLVASMSNDETGVTRQSEKILLQTYHRVFREGDAVAWLLKNVPGSNQKANERIIKLLVKKTLIEQLMGSALGGVALYRFPVSK